MKDETKTPQVEKWTGEDFHYVKVDGKNYIMLDEIMEILEKMERRLKELK